MRIGILTLPLHTNYGGILQAYALQTVLERMGHEVRVLQKNPFMKEPCFATYVKRIFQKYIFGKDVIINKERRNNRFVRENRQLTNIFIAHHIHTHTINSLNQLCELDYNAFVVGSDQVWRQDYFKSAWDTSIENAFLAFAYKWDVLRLAYAISWGNNELDYSNEEIRNCKKLVQLFHSVSVRERSGIDVCSKIFGISAMHVLDPVMLLTTSDYEKLLDNNNIESKGTVFCYFLDANQNKRNMGNAVGINLGLPVSYCLDVSERVHPPVEKFLQSIKEAEYILTDSFHGCVFSILFHKPFSVVTNEERGNDRIKSLLSMFKLTDRLVESRQSITDDLIHAPINFDSTEMLLTRYRENSFEFLNKALATI